jgi:hypothetical protein
MFSSLPNLAVVFRVSQRQLDICAPTLIRNLPCAEPDEETGTKIAVPFLAATMGWRRTIFSISPSGYIQRSLDIMPKSAVSILGG